MKICPTCGSQLIHGNYVPRFYEICSPCTGEQFVHVYGKDHPPDNFQADGSEVALNAFLSYRLRQFAKRRQDGLSLERCRAIELSGRRCRRWGILPDNICGIHRKKPPTRGYVNPTSEEQKWRDALEQFLHGNF
jgi:hypothetical protein